MLYPRFTAGRIKQLRRQVTFDLHAANARTGERIVVCRYRADFTYWEDGVFVVEDAKGWRTEMYLLKRKWMEAEYGITVREV